ncbi:MAG TPA: dienelactone hydrolase family protein [Pseudomonadales bacterium]|nr:dienelactone hydrolase family protein [Pseudomonadales bacterium]
MQVTEIQLATRKIKAYFWDSGLGVGPGIILLPDLLGVTPSLKHTAKRLSEEGYHVLMPDLYSGISGGLRFCMKVFFEQAARLNEDNTAVLNEMHNIVDFFKAFPYIEANRLGVIGICLTGGFVLHLALRDDIAAPVVFHYSFGTEGAGIPLGCLRSLNKTIQGHFARHDPLCPESRINALKQTLGEKFEVHWYPHLPHAIPHLFRLHPEGRKAWLTMLAFFQQQLRPSLNTEMPRTG